MSLNAAYVPLRGDGEELLLPRGRSDSPELEEVARDGVHGRWSHQRNLDQFFRRAYRYYTGKGAFNMIWAKVFDLLCVGSLAPARRISVECVASGTERASICCAQPSRTV